MLTLPGNLLSRIHQIHRRHIEAGTHLDAAIIGNLCLLVSAAFFSCDDYHTIGCTHTPDRSGSGVFQHRNTLDVLWIDIVSAIFHRETVDNYQRFGLGIDGSLSAHDHITATVNCQTWNYSLQIVNHVA